MPPNESRDPATGKLAAIDEILQVMYWLRGEKLAEDVTPGDLTRWVGLKVDEIAPLLKSLSDSGLVQVRKRDTDNGLRYSLSATGVREGGRRFADEFAELTRPGHGECGDPNCDCHQTGNPADCVHQHQHNSGSKS